MGHSPASLRIAAVVLVATVLVAIDTAAGRSYHQNSGIALTVIGVAVAAALALVAAGLARARRWSRTPALLTQLFFGIVGIYLLQGHRLDWGVALVVLAAAGFAAVLAPPSLRALVGREEAQPGQAQTGQTEPGPGRPAGGASRRRSARPGAE
jgi:Flp pilus assembly secretin CpaC